jgi:hypothetical protein
MSGAIGYLRVSTQEQGRSGLGAATSSPTGCSINLGEWLDAREDLDARVKVPSPSNYQANARTFRLGIGTFFSCHLAHRFRRRGCWRLARATVSTISLANVAAHVITVGQSLVQIMSTV